MNRDWNEMRKKAMALVWTRAFQTEVRASVNALRWKWTYCVQGTLRRPV